jgi:hypothetical protein
MISPSPELAPGRTERAAHPVDGVLLRVPVRRQVHSTRDRRSGLGASRLSGWRSPRPRGPVPVTYPSLIGLGRRRWGPAALGAGGAGGRRRDGWPAGASMQPYLR